MSENQGTKEYEHVPPGTEVESISGRYTIMREEVLEVDGKKLLYVLANASVDSSCCGTGGVYYAIVPGYVVGERVKTDEDSPEKTAVRPVRDEDERKRIEKMIMQKEGVGQAIFL